ncbi:MAG: hypothetical protein ACTSX7_00135 [Alphaproteobacteria bacterium]
MPAEQALSVPLVPRPGIAFTLLDGERVLGCAGLVPMGGHAEAWAMVSDALRARPMMLHRLVIRALRMQDLHWPKRLLAIARIDSRTSQKWLERLGFTPIGDDADWAFYERVSETTGSVEDGNKGI